MSVRQMAAVLAAMGLLAILAWSGATRWAPSADRYPLQGIDLAAAPPPVEWGSVRAAGADFAYLVATVGADRRDPAFTGNWDALPEAGLRRGAVHLYSLCQPGADQANAFNTVVPRAGDALPAAVDISDRDDCAAHPDRTTLVAEVQRFVTVVETHTGKPVLLRLSRSIESRYSLSAALGRPIWVVGNVVTPGYGAQPWRLWRASDFRHVEGIDGPVNWDVVAK
jgi:lysozyme